MAVSDSSIELQGSVAAERVAMKNSKVSVIGAMVVEGSTIAMENSFVTAKDCIHLTNATFYIRPFEGDTKILLESSSYCLMGEVKSIKMEEFKDPCKEPQPVYTPNRFAVMMKIKDSCSPSNAVVNYIAYGVGGACLLLIIIISIIYVLAKRRAMKQKITNLRKGRNVSVY
uniref:Uncharacterized protein n=1 Tax=Arcella intermedia TaxID=1963864 RepID=A0A6B2LD15_9EUKA